MSERSFSNELYRRSKKLVASSLIGSMATASALVGTPPISYQYRAPWSQVTNTGMLGENPPCPEDTDYAIYNVHGIGNNMVGVYASNATELIVDELKIENQLNDDTICYIGASFGTDYDIDKNADALYEKISDNQLKRVIVFAHSLGLITSVDMLNRLREKHPDDRTEFALVAFSSPGDADDVQPSQKVANTLFSKVNPNFLPIWPITYATILSQGDKWPLDQQVIHDTGVATSNTPPRLIVAESLRLLFGIDELRQGLQDIPVTLVTDRNDKVVDSERSVNTIQRRLGRKVTVLSMTHSSVRMGNHAALWWWENKDDYKVPVKTALTTSNNSLDVLHAPTIDDSMYPGRLR